jgi:hypothetical protein
MRQPFLESGGVLLFWDKSTPVCSTGFFRREIIHLEYQKHTPLWRLSSNVVDLP